MALAPAPAQVKPRHFSTNPAPASVYVNLVKPGPARAPVLKKILIPGSVFWILPEPGSGPGKKHSLPGGETGSVVKHPQATAQPKVLMPMTQQPILTPNKPVSTEKLGCPNIPRAKPRVKLYDANVLSKKKIPLPWV